MYLHIITVLLKYSNNVIEKSYLYIFIFKNGQLKQTVSQSRYEKERQMWGNVFK